MVDWWQILLILLTSVIVGLLVGGLLSYLIARLLKKPFFKRGETIEQRAEEQAKREEEEARKAREVERREIEEAEQQAEEQAKREEEEARKAREAEKRERKEAEVVEEQPILIAPELVSEVENNHKIATDPWTGKLLPFQTQVWNTNQDRIHTLPANLREDLAQAYVDMGLANSIVWLSTEIGRRSPNLDENYLKLCAKIAVRLDRITPLLKRSGN